MKKALPLLLLACLLTGCMGWGISPLEDEALPTVEAVRQTALPPSAATAPPTLPPSSQPSGEPELSLEERMATLSFVPVSGNYARKCLQDDTEYTELFLAGKSIFARMAASDTEEEVFAYNYATDEFTYLYYFSGELVSKVIYNIGEDTVIEDDSDLMETLRLDAVALREYCLALISQAGMTPQQLIDGGY